MRYVSWIITVPIILLIVLFALSNRETVTLALWPLPFVLDLPVYLAVLVPAAVGFVIGGSVAWASAARARKEVKRRRSQVAELSEEVVRARKRDRALKDREVREAEAERLAAANRAAASAAAREVVPVLDPSDTTAGEPATADNR